MSIQACGADAPVESQRQSVAADDTSPGARLYNFDSKARVAGRYIVAFKDAQRLALIRGSGRAPPEVLPDVMPDSRASLEALASALARRVDGVLGSIYDAPGMRGFAISNVSEEDVRNILARDPRVEYIEAELNFKLYGQLGIAPSRNSN